MMARVNDRERVVQFVGTLPDGTYIVEHPDGRLERKADQTDWDRVDAMTDEDIDRAIAEDPDSDPANFDWSKAEVVFPPKKQAVSIRLDEDILDYFRAQGPGYQTRINAVLRHYVDHQRERED
jgi:uncharacterized protein (DUF4415 family)